MKNFDPVAAQSRLRCQRRGPGKRLRQRHHDFLRRHVALQLGPAKSGKLQQESVCFDRERHALVGELELPVFHKEPPDPQMKPAATAPRGDLGQVVGPVRIELEMNTDALRGDRLKVQDVFPQRVEIGIHPQPVNGEQFRVLASRARNREVLNSESEGDEIEVEPAEADLAMQDLRELLLEACCEALADKLGSEEAAQAEQHESDRRQRPEERTDDPTPYAQPDHRATPPSEVCFADPRRSSCARPFAPGRRAARIASGAPGLRRRSRRLPGRRR